MKLFTLLALAAITPVSSQAADKVLNGGDACERRFEEVRADLKEWIEKGGHQALNFHAGVSLNNYSLLMLRSMRETSFACTSDKLHVGSAEKICLNENDGQGHSRIVCQREAYLALSQDEQYRITHHEFAGLSGFENNLGEQSSYSISNQISAYLDEKISKRLAVKGALGGAAAIDLNFSDFYGEYVVEGCSTSTNMPPEKILEPDLCNLHKVSLIPGKFGPDQSAVYLNFLETKTPMFGAGIVVARTGGCQLGHGLGNCGKAFEHAKFPGDQKPLDLSHTTRIENVGSATFFGRNIKYNDASGYYRQWSLVLRRIN